MLVYFMFMKLIFWNVKKKADRGMALEFHRKSYNENKLLKY